MAKYRLSYLGIGGFRAVDLKKLDCLKHLCVTDLSTIDKFTTKFSNMEELLNFLKRNEVIGKSVNNLVITIDKKEDGKIVNKRIYNGEKVLFGTDYNCLSVSFIYKWLSSKRNNLDIIIRICDNYIEKYQNAFNRIDGSSYILSVFTELRRLAKGFKDNNLEITNSVIREYQKLIEDFMTIEFFKVDKDELKYGNIVRKKNIDGTCPKQYRNIHDFVILMKKLDPDLNLYKSDKLVDQNDIMIEDNVLEEEEDPKKEHEEYLTEEDFVNIIDNLEDARKLILKPGDAYRK